MAMTLKNLLGTGGKRSSGEAELEMPTTTQVKMNAPAAGYDPLASASIMEQLRTAAAEARAPGRLPFIGHLPVVKQQQILFTLLIVFALLAVVMVWINGHFNGQVAAASGTATEMQMLSQRLARGTALAVQGNAASFEAVKDSRDRFRADLDALAKGGTARGVALDTAGSAEIQALITDITGRWDRVEKNATAVVPTQQSLVSLSKGLEGINQANTRLHGLAQQAASAVGAGCSLSGVDVKRKLAML